MTDAEAEQRFRTIIDGTSDDLWVLEGRLDLPVVLPQVEAKLTKGICLDFSGGTGDGYIELLAVDPERTVKSVWWSQDEPVLFEFRASVIAQGLWKAWLRSNDFLNQALDRISLVAGTAGTLISTRILYNETQLESCRKGERASVDCAPGGIPTRNTQALQNPHLVPTLKPSERARRALRWFRKALTHGHLEDRFLAFYIALEAIADDIEAPARVTQTCKACGEIVNTTTPHGAGIKKLIGRHPELPADTFKRLRKARGIIAHGGHTVPSARLTQLVPLVQHLAAEGISLSLGVDPTSIRVLDTEHPNFGVVAQFDYSVPNDPRTRWGSSINEAIAAMERARSQIQEPDL